MQLIKKQLDDGLANYIKKDGTVSMTGDLNMNNKKITNINSSNPTDNEVVSKKWVTDHVFGNAFLKKMGRNN